MWVARDRNGDLRLFSLHNYKKEYQKPPIRDNQYGIWCVPGQTLNSMIDEMGIDPSLFPNLKWEDEPIEVNLISTDNVDIELNDMFCQLCVDYKIPDSVADKLINIFKSNVDSKG